MKKMSKIMINNLVLLSAAVVLLLPSPHCAESSSGQAPQSSSALSATNNGNKYRTRSDPSTSSSSSSSSSSSPSLSSSSLSSNSLGSYYTNDLSSFLSSLPVISPSSTSSTSKTPSSSSSNLIPYQALLQALAQSAQPTSTSSSQQQATSNSANAAANALVSSLLSSATAASTPLAAATWMTLPTSWSSALGTSSSGGPSSFMSILRPSQPPIGGRRSSLTSRLRNIMNALFYRRETSSPMMTSGSSYSYSYRPAPYGFGSQSASSSNEFSTYPFSSYSSLYGGSPSYISSLYGGTNSGTSGVTAGFTSSSERYPSSTSSASLYGAASSYRPSFVALPSSISTSMMSGNGPTSSSLGPWSSERPASMIQGLYGKNYGYGIQGAISPYHQPSGSAMSYHQQHYHSHQPNHHYQYQGPGGGPGMTESSPSIDNSYNSHQHQQQQSMMSGNNQWSSPMFNQPGPSSSNSERGFLGPNNSNAIWSSPISANNNNNQGYWNQENGERSNYGEVSRDEGSSYYSSGSFQSRISSPISSGSSSKSSVIDRQSSVVPSPTYVGPVSATKSALY